MGVSASSHAGSVSANHAGSVSANHAGSVGASHANMGIGAVLGAMAHEKATGTHGSLASSLGSLNAVHASTTAMVHAAPNSQVGQIASYHSAMVTAVSMPTNTPAAVAARNAAIAAARADILGPATNKELTPAVVSAVDSKLGLPETDPSLGVTHY